MRTTLTLDADVAAKAKAVVKASGKPLEHVINEALRAGLKDVDQSQRRKPFRTRPQPMGLRPGLQLDNIQNLLSHVDGDGAR